MYYRQTDRSYSYDARWNIRKNISYYPEKHLRWRIIVIETDRDIFGNVELMVTITFIS